MTELTVTSAWRSDFIDGVFVDFGPGQGGASIDDDEWDILGTLFDAAGETYTLVSKTVVHDFGSPGDYVVAFQSCCRISSLVNAADQEFRVEAVVKLGMDFNGPQVSVPAIMQMSAGVPNSIDINGFISGKKNARQLKCRRF